MGLNATTQDAILNFVMGAMFLILPAFWVAALGWAGVSVGSIVDGLSNGTKDVHKAGEKGGDFARSTITTAGNSVVKP